MVKEPELDSSLAKKFEQPQKLPLNIEGEVLFSDILIATRSSKTPEEAFKICLLELCLKQLLFELYRYIVLHKIVNEYIFLLLQIIQEKKKNYPI